MTDAYETYATALRPTDIRYADDVPYAKDFARITAQDADTIFMCLQRIRCSCDILVELLDGEVISQERIDKELKKLYTNVDIIHVANREVLE